MNKLKALRLIEVTSQRQADNGTQMYFDPVTNHFYGSYESGYVRRIPNIDGFPSHIKYKAFFTSAKYPVNRRCMSNPENTYVKLYNASDREDLLARAVANYRVTLKNRKQS